jgi:type I restriction enzyme, S subunit
MSKGPHRTFWPLERLSGVFEVQLGKMLSAKARSGKSPKPYLRNKNVQWGTIDTEEVIEMDFNAGEMEKFRLRNGDLLMCEGGVPGRTAIWRDEIAECYYQKAIHRLRPLNGRVLAEFYLYWFRFAFDVTNHYGISGASSTIVHLPAAQLKALDVPVPDLAEQRQIARVLSAVQRAIERQERLIALTAELKKALMHKLFTEGTRGEPLKQTEIGLVPQSWDLTTTGSVCRSIVPGRNKPKVFDGDIPWLTTPEIKGLTYITSSLPARRVTRVHLQEVGGRVVPARSVIMTCLGEFGVVCINQIPVVINQQLHAFVCPESLDPYFLCQTLRMRIEYMERLAHKTTVPYLNKSKCESIPIAVPSPDEQKQIATVLESADRKADAELTRKRCLEGLFRTLLHQLMIAQVRVHDLDLSALDEPAAEPAGVP